jgi:methylmalonyl-CoA/ethylmalonyl-CoA epimerase
VISISTNAEVSYIRQRASGAETKAARWTNLKSLIGEKPMFKGVDHVVVAVRNFDAAVSRYETIFGMEVSRRWDEAAISMKAALFRFPDTHFVVVSNSDERGPIAAWLAERGEGIWIVAMKVDDLSDAVTDLRAKGVKLDGDPGLDAQVTGRVFVRAAETGGFQMQLAPPRRPVAS